MNQLQTYLYSLFISGLVCSILLFVQGNATKRSGLETGCACVMLAVFLFPLVSYGTSTTYSTPETNLIGNDADSSIYIMANDFTKQVMEQEYEAYITSRAEELGITLTHVSIDTQETTDGYWIPYSISYQSDLPIDQSFAREIEMNLGIPQERQKQYETTIIH